MNCERNICYQQEYNGGCDTCPCNRTAKEAIENLKKLKSFHNGSYGSSIRMAIEALEKQIPKKLNYMPDDDTCVYYHWECPECGNYYSHSIKKGIRALYGNSAVYCSRCGQRLDWEDAE